MSLKRLALMADFLHDNPPEGENLQKVSVSCQTEDCGELHNCISNLQKSIDVLASKIENLAVNCTRYPNSLNRNGNEDETNKDNKTGNENKNEIDARSKNEIESDLKNDKRKVKTPTKNRNIVNKQRLELIDRCSRAKPWLWQ
ncbi:UNVERIFIED_CONTAM: hypothetical protein RMT77_018560 [Armadillidium vulgare]